MLPRVTITSSLLFCGFVSLTTAVLDRPTWLNSGGLALTLSYKQSFHAAIYKDGDSVKPENNRFHGYSSPEFTYRYYYTPALIFQPETTECIHNNLSKNYILVFSVVMWDENYQTFIQKSVENEFAVTRAKIEVVPIKAIRIDYEQGTHRSPGCQLLNGWKPYADKSAVFSFRMVCENQEVCTTMQQSIKGQPKFFFSDKQVTFSFEDPAIIGKFITVEPTHGRHSRLYSTLDSTFHVSDIYLTAELTTRLLQEIASNVLDTNTDLADNEFVNNNQLPKITKALEIAFKIKTVSTVDFDQHQWDLVFWQNETSRPDRVAKTLNDALNVSSDKLNRLPRNNSVYQIFFDPNLTPQYSNTTMPTARSEVQSLFEQAKSYCLFDRKRFVIKPMQLHQVSLSPFRGSDVVTTLKLWVGKTAPDMGREIIVISEKKEAENSMDRVLQQMVPTGSIWGYYGTDVPAGWLLCNGQELDVTAFPDLAHLLYPNTTLPDLSGRFLLGSGSHYSSVLGETGGEQMHMLKMQEMPAHTHPVSVEYSSSLNTEGHHSEDTSLTGFSTFSGQGPRAGSTDAAGQGVPHNNMPPYVVVNYIIKT